MIYNEKSRKKMRILILFLLNADPFQFFFEQLCNYVEKILKYVNSTILSAVGSGSHISFRIGPLFFLTHPDRGFRSLKNRLAPFFSFRRIRVPVEKENNDKFSINSAKQQIKIKEI